MGKPFIHDFLDASGICQGQGLHVEGAKWSHGSNRHHFGQAWCRSSINRQKIWICTSFMHLDSSETDVAASQPWQIDDGWVFLRVEIVVAWSQLNRACRCWLLLIGMETTCSSGIIWIDYCVIIGPGIDSDLDCSMHQYLYIQLSMYNQIIYMVLLTGRMKRRLKLVISRFIHEKYQDQESHIWRFAIIWDMVSEDVSHNIAKVEEHFVCCSVGTCVSVCQRLSKYWFMIYDGWWILSHPTPQHPTNFNNQGPHPPSQQSNQAVSLAVIDCTCCEGITARSMALVSSCWSIVRVRPELSRESLSWCDFFQNYKDTKAEEG